MIPHSRPSITAAELRAVASVLRGGMLGEGVRAAALEHEIAEAAGFAGGVSCGSGCQALWLSLLAKEVGRGDEVILPTYVCSEVSETIRRMGATPVAVDVGDDWHLSFEAVADAQTRRSRAIIAPRLFGFGKDFTPLRSLGLPVIEDWAQFAHPSPERLSPTCGDIVFHSFEATKVLTAGEGGMALVRDRALLARLRKLKRIQGSRSRFNLTPLSDLQAALAGAQWRRLPAMLARRRVLAQRYLTELGSLRGIRWPDATFLQRATHFRLPFRARLRRMADGQRVIDDFAAAGIAVRRPVATLVAPGRSTPNASRLLRETLSLPLYPALTDHDQTRIIAAAQTILARLEPFDDA